MALNLEELQQKVDRVLSNSDEAVRALTKLATDTNPVPIQIYDINGNLQTYEVETIPMQQQKIDSFITGAETTIKGWWNRTFYVDQVNGDDSNDGSSDAPFKTLQKAFDSIPIGGKGTVILLNNYDTGLDTSSPTITLKTISLNLNGYKLISNRSIVVNGSKVYVLIIGTSQIEAIPYDNWGWYPGVFQTNDHEVNSNHFTSEVHVVSLKSSANPLVIGTNRTLFGVRGWGRLDTLICSYTSIYSEDGVKNIFDGHLVSALGNGVITLGYYSGLPREDSEGNSRELVAGDLIKGVIFDADTNVPINFVTHLQL
jgi:hypothetical protein